MKKLVILEMANNHFGDVQFGCQIIEDFYDVTKDYKDYFDFAFKFQFRDLDTFIHKDYKNRTDLPYVKRFVDTKLSNKDFSILKERAIHFGFKTMCTAFDEESVKLVEAMGFDIIKIASCSFNDWPLLNAISNTDLPIIASCAGSDADTIDKVVSFFVHRDKNFSLMHCVGEYPTGLDNFQLNQIDFLKKKYPSLKIGFSSHEMPGLSVPVQITISKGAEIFEKHVVIPSSKYKINAYSTTPDMFKYWLDSAVTAIKMCGIEEVRCKSSEKEQSDLLQFKRGVFSNKDLKSGDIINKNDVYYAWPNIPNQVLANDMSKYTEFVLQQDVKKDEPILNTFVTKQDNRKLVWEAVQKVKKFILDSGVVFPGKATLELSHHYGIENFYKTGITMITVVNEEYCKKLIVLLPGQSNPEHYHINKKETFFVIKGKLKLSLIEGTNNDLMERELLTLCPLTKHSFSSDEGCIIEELSTQHMSNDSIYTDNKIMENKNRKTIVNHWL